MDYVLKYFRIGKKSTRLVNAAAVKLSEELFNMIDRPDYALVTRVREGTESQVIENFVVLPNIFSSMYITCNRVCFFRFSNVSSWVGTK